MPEFRNNRVPMPLIPGLTAWKFSDGSEVACGETVAILEAMKMEVPVKAPVAGQLKQAAACGDVIGVNGIIGAIKAL